MSSVLYIHIHDESEQPPEPAQQRIFRTDRTAGKNQNEGPMTDAAPPNPGIDFARLLLQNAPDAARRLGRIGRALTAAAIGQRPFNRVMRRIQGTTPRAFLNDLTRILDLRVQLIGAEHLPTSGEFIAAANHPCGGIEGIALLQLLLERYGRVIVPANRILGYLHPLKPLMAPVDVFRRKAETSAAQAGAQDQAQARIQARRPPTRSPGELTPDDTPLLLFPAGRTAREYRGEMREFPWKRGFIRLARRTGRPVVPICVIARPSILFRSLAALRRALSIRTNLEMFLLVREVLKPRQSVKLICEPPIMADAWNSSRPDRAHAARVQHLLERRYAQNR